MARTRPLAGYWPDSRHAVQLVFQESVKWTDADKVLEKDAKRVDGPPSPPSFEKYRHYCRKALDLRWRRCSGLLTPYRLINSYVASAVEGRATSNRTGCCPMRSDEETLRVERIELRTILISASWDCGRMYLSMYCEYVLVVSRRGRSSAHSGDSWVSHPPTGSARCNCTRLSAQTLQRHLPVPAASESKPYSSITSAKGSTRD